MDTARALPQGEFRFLLGLGGGYQHGVRHRYSSPSTLHPDPDAPAFEETATFPTLPVDLDVMGRVRVGLGGGAQLELGHQGLFGGTLGLKQQLVGGTKGLVAWSVGSRLGIGGFGAGSDEYGGWIRVFTVTGETTISIHPSPDYAIYVSPTVQYSLITAVHTWDGHESCVQDDAGSYGGAVGYIHRLPTAGLSVVAEVAVLGTPAGEGQSAGVLVVGGIGILVGANQPEATFSASSGPPSAPFRPPWRA